MKRYVVPFLALVLAAFFAVSLTGSALAQSVDDFTVEVKAEVKWIDLNATLGNPPASVQGPYLALAKSEFTSCPGESLSTCVRALREKNQTFEIKRFWLKNITGCRQDGYRYEPEVGHMVTGVPAGWEGLVEGVTLRPCNVYQAPMPVAISPAPATVSPVPVAVTSPMTLTQAYAVRDGNNSALRVAPSTLAERMRWLSQGETITITGQVKSGDYVWYQTTEGGYVREDRVSFTTEPVAPAVASSSTVVVPPSNSVAAPYCVQTSVPVNWKQTGPNEWVWNAYSDNGGTFVEMTSSIKQDGEFVDGTGAHTGIPANQKVNVSGITARCD